MKNKDKEERQSKHTHPKTLGEKMLSFAQDKLTSLIESVHRVSREEMLPPRFKTLGRVSSHPTGELINRREEHLDFIYFRPPVFSNLEERWKKSEKPKGDQGVVVSPEMLKLFSRWLKMRLPSVQLHQNEVTDRLLRQRHADAMTVGTDIYFRTGKFDLRNARGLGLLAHELTHVAQLYRSDWRNQGFGHHAEQHERFAIDNERLVLANTHVLSQGNSLSPRIDVTTNSGSTSTPHSAAESETPMFADTTRNIGELPSPAPAAFSDSDMMRIKEEVYRDLMMRIKVEFERGA